jgi:hypothetical protein
MSGLAHSINRLLEAITAARIADLDIFAPDVTLDATVPNWRFTRHGAAAVKHALASWYAHPGFLEELRRVPLPAGELVEFTLCWEQQGVPHAAHQVHVLELDETGHVTSDRVWSGGHWPADLLAEMAGDMEDGPPFGCESSVG